MTSPLLQRQLALDVSHVGTSAGGAQPPRGTALGLVNPGQLPTAVVGVPIRATDPAQGRTRHTRRPVCTVLAARR